jgi:hypothetical protein
VCVCVCVRLFILFIIVFSLFIFFVRVEFVVFVLSGLLFAIISKVFV